MVSVLGLLEAKEASARERAECLRSELAAAELEVERLVCAREMVSQVLYQPEDQASLEAVPGPDAPGGRRSGVRWCRITARDWMRECSRRNTAGS